MFGRGRLAEIQQVYRDVLRAELSPSSQRFWDRRWKFFNGQGRRKSFYFHGSSGFVAWMVNHYVDRVAKVRDDIHRLLAAETIEEQREIYETRLRKRFWKKFVRWAVGRDLTLSLLGVPRAQREQVDKHYPGKIEKFVEDSIEAVFCRLPLKDNYFWRVYLTGEYTPDCCPEYLKADNFARLQGGLVDRISAHTTSVLSFLLERDEPVSRFVLLDHMDWLSTASFPLLEREWEAMLARATPDARFLWRSGGLQTDFLDRVQLRGDGPPQRLRDRLVYDQELAGRLHARDRVHTYGSFYIARLAPEPSACPTA
jgi:S-adenosylmethionine-diacylglycerol 3-amino-3-carboxypropyl transferase